MNTPTFLDKLSQTIVSDFNDKLSETTIVLPNKRAKVFLIESLKNQLETISFAPMIISIEDFIQDISALRTMDSIELLFEFYIVFIFLTYYFLIDSFFEFVSLVFYFFVVFL